MLNAPYTPFTLSDSIGYFFCGAVILLLVIVLIVFLKTKERIYLYYTLFLFFSLLYALVGLKEMHGYSNFVLDYMRNNWRLTEPVTLLSFAFYIFFALKLVNIDTQRPVLSRGLRSFGMACVVYSLLYLLFYDYVVTYSRHLFVGSRILIFSLSCYLLVQIYRQVTSPVKTFFLAGSVAYYIGSIVASLRFTLADLPSELFYMLTSTSYFQLGILLQALFFALALGERVVFLYQEQGSAQQTRIEELTLQEHVTREVNKRLEKEIEAGIQEMTAIKEKMYKQERDHLTAEYERKLIQSEIQAKRAQINPHFIFNSLNAIKFLILQQESEKATKYLVMFSRFIRSLMDSMEKDTIPLEDELKIINDYLMLEKWRFNDHFAFSIIGGEPNKLTPFRIPPLLLQPFVENAIWHGLLVSERTEKNLSITLNYVESQVHIVIQDNGAGRGISPTAKRIHGGMGIPLTEERIKLFNLQHDDMKITMHIEDLKGEKGVPLGTRVHLSLELINTAEPQISR